MPLPTSGAAGAHHDSAAARGAAQLGRPSLRTLPARSRLKLADTREPPRPMRSTTRRAPSSRSARVAVLRALRRGASASGPAPTLGEQLPVGSGARCNRGRLGEARDAPPRSTTPSAMQRIARGDDVGPHVPFGRTGARVGPASACHARKPGVPARGRGGGQEPHVLRLRGSSPDSSAGSRIPVEVHAR